MQRFKLCAISIALIVGCAWLPTRADEPKAKGEVAKPAIIPAPPLESMAWENLRLRSANIELQIGALQRAKQDIDAEADKALAAMMKTVGDDYQPRMSQQGKLEFALKPEPKTEVKPESAKPKP